MLIRTALAGLAAAALAAAGILPAAAAPDPVKIRIASDHTPPPHPAALAEILFQERLAEEIPGSEVLLFPAKALYSVPEAVEAMTEGNLEMTWGQFGKTAQVDPFMAVVVGPMLLTTPGAIDSIEGFDTYKMLVKRFEELHDIKIFGHAHLSFYMGAGSGSRLLKPDDFAGRKIRSMSPVENAALSAWGAKPHHHGLRRRSAPALETGVIDGPVDQPRRLQCRQGPGALLHRRRHQRHRRRLLLDRRQHELVELARRGAAGDHREADRRGDAAVCEEGQLVQRQAHDRQIRHRGPLQARHLHHDRR